MSGDIPTENAALVNESISLISYTTVVTVMYTLSFVLYCLCARLSYSQLRDPDRKRRTSLTFALASVLIICATMDAALDNQYLRILFVDYRSLPGGPLGLAAQAHGATILQIDDVVNVVGQSLAMGVLLWRVRVVCSGTRFTIAINILALVFYLLYVVSYILQVVFLWVPLSGALPNITRTLDIVFETSSSVSAASPLAMALMIATRLILVRRKHIKFMGRSDVAAQYLNIAAMMIECYALSAAWNIGYLISYILKNPPAHNFFNPTVQQAEYLSYFLVLYRVFAGRAWDQHTQTKLSTIRWDRGSTQATNEADGLSTGTANVRISNIEAHPPAFTSRIDAAC